jgi:hypothetical protein
MMGLVRMPYSNNWRVPEAKVHADCPTCTVPAASGKQKRTILMQIIKNFIFTQLKITSFTLCSVLTFEY